MRIFPGHPQFGERFRITTDEALGALAMQTTTLASPSLVQSTGSSLASEAALDLSGHPVKLLGVDFAMTALRKLGLGRLADKIERDPQFKLMAGVGSSLAPQVTNTAVASTGIVIPVPQITDTLIRPS